MHVTIGVDLPLPDAQSSLDAITLAVDGASVIHGIADWSVAVAVKNDVLLATGAADPQQGAENVTSLVADSSVVAMIGPLNSTVARAEIPISNAAGLLQCGFSTTAPDLTEPPGALLLRSTVAGSINFVRLAAPDELQGAAGARFAAASLHAKRAVVLDDNLTFGQAVAAGFAEEFVRQGGVVAGRASLTVELDARAAVVRAKAQHPDIVYFGGAEVSGAGLVRAAMGEVGLGGVPFLGPDGIADPSFVQEAGRSAAGSYATIDVVGRYPGSATFTASYRAAYGHDPGPYDAAAHACAQVVLAALGAIGATDASGVRRALRTYVTDSSHVLPTVLGDVSFDANGDTTRPVISINGFDPAAGGGRGDWVYVDQVAFGSP